MKFTLSWLKEHLDTTAGVDEISETLTRIGLEVEEVVNPAAALDGFITARIDKVDKHPDSDHLHILAVNTGKETLSSAARQTSMKVWLAFMLRPEL